MIVLLPSPFLGPAMWQPVGTLLVERGCRVVTPEAASAPRAPADVLESYLAALPADDELIVVPHSNAGLYTPLIAAQRRVQAFVFVDALLPASTGHIEMAPPAALLDDLRARADASGLLPPWTHWWDEDEIAPLFPDGATRDRVENDQHRLPLSYFEDSLPIPTGWDERPGSYLAFGDTYARERAAARSRGWPVVTLAGAHLHMLVEPEQVASQILSLVEGSTGNPVALTAPPAM